MLSKTTHKSVLDNLTRLPYIVRNESTNGGLLKPLAASILALVLALPATGCSTITYYTQTQKPVVTSDLPKGYEFKQHISESKRNIYLVWGLVPFRVVEQHEILAPYLKTGDGLANVTSKQEWDLLSWLIAGFSYSFVQTLNTKYEADLLTKTGR